MSAGTTVLVDTNVWLDHYLARPSGRPSAATRLLTWAAQDESVSLAYASTTAKDVFFLVAKLLKNEARAAGGAVDEDVARAANEAAWACVENMGRLACAVGADEADLWTACKQRDAENDLEDALILAAARRCSADYLATNDAVLQTRYPALARCPERILADIGAVP